MSSKQGRLRGSAVVTAEYVDFRRSGEIEVHKIESLKDLMMTTAGGRDVEVNEQFDWVEVTEDDAKLEKAAAIQTLEEYRGRLETALLSFRALEDKPELSETLGEMRSGLIHARCLLDDYIAELKTK